ncbi:hypothetical protein ACPEOH_001189 [Yersinia enterocolitica]
MNDKPLIIDALEAVGPCDLGTLAGHMGQSENIINAMLVNHIRKGVVLHNSGMYRLSNKVPSETRVSSKKPDDNHPWKKGLKKQPEFAPTPLPKKVTNTDKQNELQPTKAALIRKFIAESGREVTPHELAVFAGVEIKSISGRLQKDVTKGVLILRKDGHRSFYSWAAEVKGEKNPLSIPEVDEIASTNFTDSEVSSTSGEPPVVAIGQINAEVNDASTCTSGPQALLLAETAGHTSDKITVPTSKILSAELYELDDKLVLAQQHLSALRIERQQKGELFVLVERLEQLLKGGAQ